MKYYQVFNRIVLRGDPSNATTFQSFVDGEWRDASYLGWQLLYGDLLDYQEITKNEADKLISRAV